MAIFYIALLLGTSFLLNLSVLSTAAATLNTTQSLRDGNSNTLVSSDGMFELGFFSPGSSKNRYLGIWYSNIPVQTVIWVANRDVPLTNSSGNLKVTPQGVLVLLNHNGTIIWSTNASRPARNPVAMLLDSGNLVVKDEGDNNPENFLWQSFDYPTDTEMAEMKFGKNLVTGLDRYYQSWKSPDDPARGNITYRLDPSGYPEIYVIRDSRIMYRSGPWNGMRFSGTPHLKPNPVFTFDFVFNDEEIYYIYRMVNKSTRSRLLVSPAGDIQRFMWIERTSSWLLYSTANTDNCERYKLCGAFGSCDINNSPVCSCLKGFVPKNPRAWNMVDWSDGCVRKTKLNCSGDGFIKYSGMKLPETRNSWYSRTMTLEECRDMCLKNCSCTAYANLDARGGGSGCLLWFDELIDIRIFIENEPDIYIRVAASDLDGNGDEKTDSKDAIRRRTWIILSSVLSAGFLLLALAFIFYICRRRQQKDGKMGGIPETTSDSKSKEDDLELPLFDLATLASATNNFSNTNKLGQGGFGPVYKGTLKNGQEIAVKRLSKNSRQGIGEFKNEVKHIVKLQHRNLVKLLGCCIEADEKMLVYEFMPNKSLDFFIFDETQGKLLDWPMRYSIINGVARGILYLHQDSRLRIVHRDLKASNVLLDYEMNPKISDFGLARSFGENVTEANTNKVVGTYGYISPEYAMDGLYSIKSDVFSFGVLVLEIVSGKRNRGFHHPEHHLNLLGHAWRLFTEGRTLELVAESLVESCDFTKVVRSIHIGLLCVQEIPEDRPSMSNVVLMMGSEGALPVPKQPGFFTERDIEENSTSTQNKPYSANECSITLLEAR
ncbi:hypothetical protein Tsubulata_005406 [Turnera subulata]|uniref:Receptor-like serine/threonine-protein kinase n=1 Tax=Turnera subulata TaxID=218843 RepID=A0A9Q0G5X7_9ROSI|nr:hypothetical protein Tsubulata_005406 [Turnera subulata]